MELPPDTVFADMGFTVHHWDNSQLGHVTVLQKEPFRLRWGASQLVTFVFIIDSKIATYSEIEELYSHLLDFAKKHKRTLLPRGLQCGYALLPIYIADRFESSLRDRIRTEFKKRWCVFHLASLYEIATGDTVTLQHGSFWGWIYRDYIRTTIRDVTDSMFVLSFPPTPLSQRPKPPFADL